MRWTGISSNDSGICLNANENGTLSAMVGFHYNIGRAICYHTLSILLCGFPYLISYWFPVWTITWRYSHCEIKMADLLLVRPAQLFDTEKDGKEELVSIKIESVGVSTSISNENLTCVGAFFISKPASFGGPVDNSIYRPLLEQEEEDDPTEEFIIKYFELKNVRFVWHTISLTFVPINRLPLVHFDGLSAQQQIVLRLLYGPNRIDVPVKSYFVLLYEEILNPFYIFQIGSIILWALDNYIYYSSCILFVSVVCIIMSLVETKRQSLALHAMVEAGNSLLVCVKRGGSDILEHISSTLLVPGDIISIPAHGCVMCCDAVIISGTAIVNESMLTGESVPVSKCQIEKNDIHGGKRNTLFSGTEVIRARHTNDSHIFALVLRTGFATSKGQLVSSILYPSPIGGFTFYRDAIRFVLLLFCIASLGMVYCLYIFIHRKSDFIIIILRCLDIITIVVPPALPAAMTVGIYYAQGRLKRNNNIYCISPQRINLAGKVKMVCFDKTGTLTEDGLSVLGVFDAHESKFIPCNDIRQAVASESYLMTCLVSCHSLAVINDVMIGDPLDIKMFETTGWSLDEISQDPDTFDCIVPLVIKPPVLSGINSMSVGDEPQEIGIIRQFAFNSNLARMSVITRRLHGDRFCIFTKGAPERIHDICLPNSIPSNFDSLLNNYTLKGFRVIALAYRELSKETNWIAVQRLKRVDVEKDLTFLGFLVMLNRLKDETTEVIKALKMADIRCVMVTGDNILTAISVAKQCHMISLHDDVYLIELNKKSLAITLVSSNEDSQSVCISIEDANSNFIENSRNNAVDYHFAMSGTTWAHICIAYPHLIDLFISKGTVFARMEPDQKTQLVKSLQSIDYVVGMCGDGANDCGALRAADVGVSLSEAEASVAAPFTSHTPNIECVPSIIREGRCALVTSFGLFKYMALYSLVQFVSVLLLYTLGTNLGDTQFLYIDLVITTTVALLMSWSGPYFSLAPKRPSSSLISGPNIISVLCHIILAFLFQFGAFIFLNSCGWYTPLQPPYDDDQLHVNWATTTIFIVSSFQYITLAIIFSRGKPFRQPLYHNIMYVTALIILIAFTTVLCLIPPTIVADFFQINGKEVRININYYFGERASFRLVLLGLAALNFVICLFFEVGVIQSRWLKLVLHYILGKKQPKNKFKKIRANMSIPVSSWPLSLQSAYYEHDESGFS